MRRADEPCHLASMTCMRASGRTPFTQLQGFRSSSLTTTATGVIALAYITATNPGSALLDANKNHRGRHMERVERMKLLGHVCFKRHGIGDDGNGRRKRARSSWIFPKPTRFVSAKRMAKLPVLGATARLVLYPEAPR